MIMVFKCFFLIIVIGISSLCAILEVVFHFAYPIIIVLTRGTGIINALRAAIQVLILKIH